MSFSPLNTWYNLHYAILFFCEQAVAQLDPKVITMVQWDSDQQQPFFLRRFRTALHFFSNVFESHEVLAGRPAFGRQGFEERVLAREIVNLVSCEGMQRLVRAEGLDQMHKRSARSQLLPRPFASHTLIALKQLLGQYPRGFDVVEHPDGGIRLLWAGRSILGASAWIPSRKHGHLPRLS